MHSGKPLHRTFSSFLYSHNLSQVEKWHALAEIRSLSPQVSSRMLLNLTLLLLRNCNCTNWCKLHAQPLALKDQQWYLDCFLSVQCWLWRCPATQQALRKNMEKLWTTTHNYGKKCTTPQGVLPPVSSCPDPEGSRGHLDHWTPALSFLSFFLSLSLSLCLVPAALAGLCSDTSGCQIMSIINAILGCYLPSPSSTAIASYQPYGHRFQHTSSNNNGEQEIPDKDHKKQWNIFKFEEILKLSKKILSPPFSTNDWRALMQLCFSSLWS